MGGCRDAEAELNLPPGFRFHPTDDELVIHYLCRKAAHQHLPVPIIADVDLYKYNPWDLPEKALFGQREWYFFTPRDRKYPNGSRPNRAAGWGYWKATGADKPVSPAGSSRPVGIKKALVFYHGKAPKGVKTDWIMHEYRLADTNRAPNKRGSLRLDEWVLCRLYNKKNTREKMQRGDASFCVPTVSMEDNEETGSENIRTPESDVDHDTFTDLDDLGHPGAYPPRASEGLGTARPSGACGFQTVEQQKEESDWFMGLNLDEWQSTLLAPPPLDMPSQDYYFPVLGSPQLRPSQTSVPPF